MKAKVKKILKYSLITLASLLLLITLLIFSLRIPAVQNYVKGHLISYLERQIGTEVRLDRVFVGFPNSLELENLYLRGQKVDTLLYAKKFRVDLDMWQLLNSKADLTAIDLQGLKANVVRNPDGTFNFDYIIDAFASDKKKEEKDNKPFILSLDKIDLNDINITFIDQQSRNQLAVYFNSFNTRVKKFDLEKNAYGIGDISLDGLKLKLHQDIVEEVAKNVEKKVDSLREKNPLKLDLNGIKLTNFDIDYGDQNTKTFAKILFKELSTKVNTLDIEKSNFNINHLKLIGANINAKLHLPEQKVDNKANHNLAENKTKEEAMRLFLGKLLLQDVQVSYSNTAATPTKSGMDFNYLNFNKLNTEVRNFKMENGTFAGSVNSAEIQEKRGLNIQKFTADFIYKEQQAYLRNLHLQTPRTLLRDEIILNYNSVEQLSKNPGSVGIIANVPNSKIGLADVLLFAPDLKNTAPFNKYPNAILNLNTRLRGRVDDLEINTFQLSGLGDLKASLSGRIRNATNPNQLFYDLRIQNISTSQNTLNHLVPKGTMPDNITLASSLLLSGFARGTTQMVDTNLRLISNLGNATIRANADLRQKNNERYDVYANLQNLQIGKIIQNKDLGIITGTVSAKGQSFDFSRGNAVLKGNIAAMDYNGYRYNNVNLDGKLNRGAYRVHLNSKDANANLNILASGIYNEKNPTIQLEGNIVKLDLHKLGFYKEPLSIAGKLDGKFTNLNPDFLNGHLNLNHFAISDGKEVMPIQEFSLKAVSTKESNSLSINSQIIDIELIGRYKITQIFGALQNTINHYYQFQKPGKQPKIEPHQYFALNAKIKDDDLIRKFVPDLKSFETITIVGNYDADSQKINLDAKIPNVQYAENKIESATFRLDNESEKLNYALNAGRVATSSMEIHKIAAVGDISDNIINYNITTKDDKDEVQFLVAGNLQSLKDATQISLNPDGLKLNYNRWNVAADNKIQIGEKGIWARNFVLSNAGSELSINSETESPNSPLNVGISNFKIEDILEMVKKDTLLAKGTINGNVRLKDFKNLNLTSDIKISELQVYNHNVGEINAQVNTKSADLLGVNIGLTGFENDVKITGNYNIKQTEFDLNAAFNRLQMKTVEGFTMGAITNTEGYISGNMAIKGTPSSPNILGGLRFNNAGLEIVKTGSHFRNLNDEIRFVSDGIRFDNFRLKDAEGNALAINGRIITQNYSDFAFNLDVTARDFQVVNAKEDSDRMMYGLLAINADLNIRGNLDLPKVGGSIAVADNTDFTFVVPQSSPTKQSREGIVEFIDQNQIALNKTIKANTIDSNTNLRGMDVNVNISVTKEAKLSLIIDKASGDFVKLQGEADLTGGIDPSGRTNLVGVYKVEQGAYEMSFSMVRRRFDLQKGSTITWTGEPLLAQLNMTAIYTTRTAPLDLVQQQLGSQSIAPFKQRIPFEAHLVLGGELMKPQLSFDIQTSRENNAVSQMVIETIQSRLSQLRQDENEMNKQVFALLILNRFIGDNPFQSETGMSAGTMARQSVSQILSQQLNNIASDLIAGVDLTFDLDSYEDFSTGNRNERTDLNVNLSRRLLDDRLKISVGSNFGVEGDARPGEQMTNIAGNISADYMLSKDGRYTLRAYRKNDYQVAMQGQIIETGVGFILTFDYNEFRDIMRNARRNREINRKIRKAERAEKEVEFVK